MESNTYLHVERGYCDGCDKNMKTQHFTNIDSYARGQGKKAFNLWFCRECMDKVMREYTLKKIGVKA